MQNVINIATNILKIHPRNTEFFDDIKGQEYDSFKKSIQESGVVSPILVSPDMIIISGHQRVKACRDLGIKLVPVIIREDLTDDDEVLKILLTANFGRKENGEAKQRKIAAEYVKLCGLKNGEQLRHNGRALPMREIAQQLGTSERNLQRAIRIENNLTDSMKELLDTGVITKTLASDTVSSLSVEEQEELVKSLDITKKITQKQIQQYIDKIKQLESQPPKTIEKVIDNTDTTLLLKNKKLSEDLEKLKRDNENLSSTNRILDASKKTTENISESYKKLSEEYKKQSEEYMNVKSKIIDMGLEPDGEYNLYSAASEIAKLTKEIEIMLVDKLAPTRYKNFMIAVKSSDILRKNFRNTLDMVNDWYVTMIDYMNDSNKETNNYNNVVDMEEK